MLGIVERASEDDGEYSLWQAEEEWRHSLADTSILRASGRADVNTARSFE